MTWDGKFKYEPMSPNKVQFIMELYKGKEIYEYIMELYELINYQKDIISQQRIEIISLKHKEAWKRYDLPENKFTTSIDKTDNSSRMDR